MTKQEFIEKVSDLGLSPQEYIIVGSGLLAVLELRSADDVDAVVSTEVFARFEQAGDWEEKHFDDGSHYLTKGIYEIGVDWDSEDAQPNLQDLKADQEIHEGIPFVSLHRLMTWKTKRGKQKDLKDIELIQKHLEEQE